MECGEAEKTKWSQKDVEKVRCKTDVPLPPLNPDCSPLSIHPSQPTLTPHQRMWDLNAFNIMDAAASRPRKDRLDVKEVVQFKKSTRDLLQWANTHFPQTKKMYRTVHATKVTQGTWWVIPVARPKGTSGLSRTRIFTQTGSSC